MSFVFVNSSGDTFTPTQSGAVGTWIWEMCQAAQRAGAEPWVVTRRGSVASYEWSRTIFTEYPLGPANSKMHRILRTAQQACGWTGINQQRYCWRVAQAILEAGLDRSPLMLQNDLELAVYLRRALPHAYIIHHAHNQNDSTWRFRPQFKRSVNLATAVSGFCAEWNARNFGCPVETLLSGIDTERFSPAAERPSGPIVLNFVGRTDPPKAPDLLLKAALQLVGKVPPFALQILGRNFYDHAREDAYQTELRTLADQLRSRGVEVRMAGWITRENLPAELRQAHIHVVPARWDEPFGFTTLEGMAAGLATVAARTGGTPEVTGDAALLFARENVEELALQLGRLIADETLRLEYARRARARALELSWNMTWHRLVALLAARGRPVPIPAEPLEAEPVIA